MYGKIMSITDSLIMSYLELLTDIPDLDLVEIRQAMESESVNPMSLKKRLAEEIAAAEKPLAAHDRAFAAGRPAWVKRLAAMKEGAFDFLTKPVEPEQFLAVIAAAKEHVAESESCSRDAARYEERLKNLTPREAEVMDAVVAGDLNKQIAHDLGLAEKTVKVHRARVMKKMGVRSVAELVRVSVTKRIDLS